MEKMSSGELNMNRNPLDEIEETNEYLLDDENNLDIKREDSNKTILDLKKTISQLEETNKDLKTKVNTFTKKQSLSTMLLVGKAVQGLRKKLSWGNKGKDDAVKIAEIMKEKDELKQMNEKMLDMLTEKEIENDELNEKFENYKLEVKIENEKNLEHIKELEEKIEALENAKNDEQFEEFINEYEKQKENLKEQINEYNKLEEDLNNQIEEKDKKIQILNEEIQNLQFENLRLVNKSDRQNELNQANFIDMEKLTEENNKYKATIESLTSDLNKKKKELKAMEEDRYKDTEKYKGEIEQLKKNFETKLENYKNLDELNKKLNDSNKEINICLTNLEKSLNDEKEKNFKIQTKLDKNTKELKNINDYYKKLKSNNDNLIEQYQSKIDEITKDKNNLISQNKELLEKLKSKKEVEDQGLSLDEMMKEVENDTNNNNINKDNEDLIFYKNENNLLKEEIKELKEQLSEQAHDLVELDTLEKNIEKLKIENEELSKNNKELKVELEKEKQLKKLNLAKSSFERFDSNKKEKNVGAFRRVQTLSRKELSKSTSIEKEKNLLQKQIDMMKKIREEEKKNYQTQIDKIKQDMEIMKLKFVNKQMDCDNLLLKYKNIFKSISNQCKAKGIKLSVNF